MKTLERIKLRDSLERIKLRDVTILNDKEMKGIVAGSGGGSGIIGTICDGMNIEECSGRCTLTVNGKTVLGNCTWNVMIGGPLSGGICGCYLP